MPRGWGSPTRGAVTSCLGEVSRCLPIVLRGKTMFPAVHSAVRTDALFSLRYTVDILLRADCYGYW